MAFLAVLKKNKVQKLRYYFVSESLSIFILVQVKVKVPSIITQLQVGCS